MISTTALHAVKALVLLASLPEGDFSGASAVAKKIAAPPNYLGKLLQGLAGHGLVISRKGLGGGFRLRRAPDTISLLDVVEPIDRVTRWSGCILGRQNCEDEDPCAIHDRWKAVREAYLQLLSRTSIADLVAKGTDGIKWPDRALAAPTVNKPKALAKLGQKRAKAKPLKGSHAAGRKSRAR